MDKRNKKTGPIGERGRYKNDCIYLAIPWISYTHISHTDSGKKDFATPMFDFGKYTEKDGKMMMPLSIEVHHSFVDGVHIGMLIEKIQKYLYGM